MADISVTWPKNLLCLYDAYTIAKIQRWFGLYPSPIKENGHSPPQANVGATPTENGECVRRSGRPGSEGDTPGANRDNSHVEPQRYIIHNKLWFYMFSFGAWLGSDEFYFMVFSMTISNLSWWVSRRMLLTWAICMYIGQASKELLKWPRPRDPPVVRMEGRYLMEYGMPSTHAMVGTLVPFSYLIGTWNHYEVRLHNKKNIKFMTS